MPPPDEQGRSLLTPEPRSAADNSNPHGSGSGTPASGSGYGYAGAQPMSMGYLGTAWSRLLSSEGSGGSMLGSGGTQYGGAGQQGYAAPFQSQQQQPQQQGYAVTAAQYTSQHPPHPSQQQYQHSQYTSTSTTSSPTQHFTSQTHVQSYHASGAPQTTRQSQFQAGSAQIYSSSATSAYAQPQTQQQQGTSHAEYDAPTQTQQAYRSPQQSQAYPSPQATPASLRAHTQTPTTTYGSPAALAPVSAPPSAQQYHTGETHSHGQRYAHPQHSVQQYHREQQHFQPSQQQQQYPQHNYHGQQSSQQQHPQYACQAYTDGAHAYPTLHAAQASPPQSQLQSLPESVVPTLTPSSIVRPILRSPTSETRLTPLQPHERPPPRLQVQPQPQNQPQQDLQPQHQPQNHSRSQALHPPPSQPKQSQQTQTQPVAQSQRQPQTQSQPQARTNHDPRQSFETLRALAAQFQSREQAAIQSGPSAASATPQPPSQPQRPQQPVAASAASPPRPIVPTPQHVAPFQLIIARPSGDGAGAAQPHSLPHLPPHTAPTVVQPESALRPVPAAPPQPPISPMPPLPAAEAQSLTISPAAIFPHQVAAASGSAAASTTPQQARAQNANANAALDSSPRAPLPATNNQPGLPTTQSAPSTPKRPRKPKSAQTTPRRRIVPLSAAQPSPSRTIVSLSTGHSAGRVKPADLAKDIFIIADTKMEVGTPVPVKKRARVLKSRKSLDPPSAVMSGMSIAELANCAIRAVAHIDAAVRPASFTTGPGRELPPDFESALALAPDAAATRTPTPAVARGETPLVESAPAVRSGPGRPKGSMNWQTRANKGISATRGALEVMSDEGRELFLLQDLGRTFQQTIKVLDFAAGWLATGDDGAMVAGPSTEGGGTLAMAAAPVPQFPRTIAPYLVASSPTGVASVVPALATASQKLAASALWIVSGASGSPEDSEEESDADEVALGGPNGHVPLLDATAAAIAQVSQTSQPAPQPASQPASQPPPTLQVAADSAPVPVQAPPSDAPTAAPVPTPSWHNQPRTDSSRLDEFQPHRKSGGFTVEGAATAAAAAARKRWDAVRAQDSGNTSANDAAAGNGPVQVSDTPSIAGTNGAAALVTAAPVTAAPVTAAPVTAAPVTAAPVAAAPEPHLHGATLGEYARMHEPQDVSLPNLNDIAMDYSVLDDGPLDDDIDDLNDFDVGAYGVDGAEASDMRGGGTGGAPVDGGANAPSTPPADRVVVDLTQPSPIRAPHATQLPPSEEQDEKPVRLGPFDRAVVVIPITRARRDQLIANGWYEPLRDDVVGVEKPKRQTGFNKWLEDARSDREVALQRGRHLRLREPETIRNRFEHRPGPAMIEPWASVLTKDSLLNRVGHYPCEWKGCDAELATEALLQRHVRARRHTEQGTFTGGYMGQFTYYRCLWRGCDGPVFADTAGLLQHITARHIAHRLVCPYGDCELTSPTIAHLHRHVLRTHDESEAARPRFDEAFRPAQGDLEPVPERVPADELTTQRARGTAHKLPRMRDWARSKILRNCIAPPEPEIHIVRPPHMLEPLEPGVSTGFVTREPSAGGGSNTVIIASESPDEAGDEVECMLDGDLGPPVLPTPSPPARPAKRKRPSAPPPPRRQMARRTAANIAEPLPVPDDDSDSSFDDEGAPARRSARTAATRPTRSSVRVKTEPEETPRRTSRRTRGSTAHERSPSPAWDVYVELPRIDTTAYTWLTMEQGP